MIIAFLKANWTWLLSFGTFVVGMGSLLFTRIRALELGVQALLRSQMIELYQRYKPLGIVPISVKQNFENLWVQYERLGKNGVMQGIHAEFMALQTDTKT